MQPCWVSSAGLMGKVRVMPSSSSASEDGHSMGTPCLCVQGVKSEPATSSPSSFGHGQLQEGTSQRAASRLRAKQLPRQWRGAEEHHFGITQTWRSWRPVQRKSQPTGWDSGLLRSQQPQTPRQLSRSTGRLLISIA